MRCTVEAASAEAQGEPDFVELATSVEVEAEPDFVEMEMVAVASLVTDLAAVVAALAPGALDRNLHVSRVRLQVIETQRADPAVANEATILRFKISMLETALGRRHVPPAA